MVQVVLLGLSERLSGCQAMIAVVASTNSKAVSWPSIMLLLSV